MKLARKERKAEIPDDSMADIAFLLIVFFMLTTTFSVNKGFDYGIPPKEEEASENSQTRTALTVIVNADNTSARSYEVLVVDENGNEMRFNRLTVESKPIMGPNGPVKDQHGARQWQGGLFSYMDETFTKVSETNPEWYKLPVYVLMKREAPFEGFVDVWEEVRKLEEKWSPRFPSEVEPEKRKLATHVPNVNTVDEILYQLSEKYGRTF
jgi:hypothetical protein